MSSNKRVSFTVLPLLTTKGLRIFQNSKRNKLSSPNSEQKLNKLEANAKEI